MRDELVEAVKVAILTAIVEHGVPTDIQEHLVRGDGRGTVLPGALDRMAKAALAVAEPAIRADEREKAWRPIETAPRDGRPILLFARAVTATAPVIVVGWHLPEQGWIESSFSRPVGIVPTHWQPLPEPPAIRAGQGERG